MTLDEAIVAVASEYKIIDEIGFDDNDDLGRRDMSRAPTGEKYLTICSGGVREQGESSRAFFTSDEDAISAWLCAVWDEAERVGKGEKLALYWREKPAINRAEFVAIDQVALMNDPEQRSNITLSLCYVGSRMLIAKDPS